MSNTEVSIVTPTTKGTTLKGASHYTHEKQIIQECNHDSKQFSKISIGFWLDLRYSLLMVLGTALVFTESRNMLFWHLQRFWTASGVYWQTKWETVLSITGGDPFTLWFVISLVLTTATYWIIGGIYTILDITNKPTFIRRYKVQPGTNEPIDTKRLQQVVLQVLFNQIIIGMLMGYLMFVAMGVTGYPPHKILPTFHRAFLELAGLIIIEEIGFYYSHRILHHRFIYKYIHKKHHEWTAPIAITAVYCHPIEHMFSNLLPPLLGVYMLGSHVVIAWFWFCLAIWNTVNTHSGYHLPFLPSPEAHDFHHLKFNQCYGVLGILDRLHNTDSVFRSSKAFARHIMMLGFTPVRETFPEQD